MGCLSFIHCSDLHLGCQQFNEPQRWEDFGKTFEEIVDYAIKHQVNYFLIGGDFFHHRSINAATLRQAISLLEKLKSAGITVIAIEGNHDKAFYLEKESWMNFLNQQGYLCLLKPDFNEGKIQLSTYHNQKGCIFEEEEIRIIGLGYLGATTKQRLEEVAELISPSDKFTVILLHAAVDKLLGQDMAGVKLDTLELFKDKVDYFALGHIHSRQEKGGFIFNPGAPESIHIDETRNQKEKGFYHVLIRDGEMDVQFVPSTRRPVYYYDVDLTGISDPSEVLNYVMEKIENQDELPKANAMIEIILYGNIEFNSYIINIKEIEEMVKSKYHSLAVEVINNANLPVTNDNLEYTGFDRAALEKEVIGQMFRREKPELKEFEDEFVNLIVKVKDNILANVSPEELVSNVENVLKNISLTEVAVDIEGGEESEN